MAAAYACVGSDWRLEREEGEADGSFKQRALKLAPRRPGAITVLREVLA